MKLIGSRLLALINLLALLAASASASVNGRYGGTLRVELQQVAVSLNPREWRPGTLESAVNEKLAALVFDRLVTLDNYGRFQPQLATEWSHDAAFKRWQFVLRAGVRFSDGSELTAGDVATALQPLLPGGQQVITSGTTVVVQSLEAMPDLLEELSSGRFFVYRIQPDGTLLGTGPFYTGGSQAAANTTETRTTARHENSSAVGQIAAKLAPLRFRANESTWSGRPFVDAVEVTLGVPPLRQLFDMQLGKADVVEIAPDLVHRAMQENQRVWSSSPVTLYGLAFEDSQPAASDAKLREAISLSLDRHTMASVLLQKQAEPAAALLPQWLSGYAFLFTMETNPDRAKEIRAALPANAASTEPVRLRVDASGDLAKLLGERIAVNVRQATIPVQVLNHPLPRNVRSATTSTEPPATLHLFAWHYSSLSPRVELETLVSSLNLGSLENSNASTDLERLYARERKLLEDRRVLPLVTLPEYVGIGRNVRDWMPSKWGEWHLADVWLDLPQSAPASAGNANLPVMQMGSKP